MLDLIELIKSMGKREKFLFTKMYKGSSNKNFYKLYKYILSNSDSSILEAKKYFSDTPISKNINSEIKQLYDRILKVLYIYQLESKDPKKEVLKNLGYAKILIERGQNNRASRLLAKTKKAAYINEDYSLIVKIISLEEELNFDQIDSELKEKLETLRQERLRAIHEIELYVELKYLKTAYIKLQYIEGMVVTYPEQFPELFSNPLNLEINTISQKSKSLWYSVVEFRYMFLDELRKSLEYCVKHFKHVEANQSVLGQKELILALNNLIFVAGIVKDEEHISKYMGVLDIMTPDVGLTEEFIHYIKMYLYTYTDNRLLNYDQIRVRVSQIDYVKSVLLNLNSTQQGIMLFHYVAGCLLVGEYGLSLDYQNLWDTLKSDNFKNVDRKVFRLIAYTKMKQFSLMASELKSLQKLKSLKSGGHAVGIAFVTFFKQFLKDKEVLESVANEFIRDLKILKADPVQKKHFILFDYMIWAEKEREIRFS